MKQFFAIVIFLSLVFCLTACGSDNNSLKTENISVSSTDDATLDTSETPESLLDSLTGTTDAIEKPDSEPGSISPLASSSSSLVTSPEPSQPVPDSSVQASSDTAADMMPADDFYGNSVDELLEWIRSNQQKDLTGQTFLATVTEERKLIIPRSVKEGLQSGSIEVEKDSNICAYNFQTNESKINNENQLYTITVKPLTEDELNKDLTELYYPDKTILKGTYNGIEYAYKDGYEGTGKADRFFASAWFIKDGHVLKITAFWANSFKPWSNEYFDYFEFDTVTL